MQQPILVFKIGTASITDEKGNLDETVVRTIAKNESLLKEGFFTWDGIDDNGNKANVAIYLILMQTKNIDGSSKILKKKCGLAAPLN